MARGRTIMVLLCSWPILLIAAAATPATAQPVTAPMSAPLPPPARAACPVTLPITDAPPGEPDPSEPTYYGNGALWTVLWPDGRVVFEPRGPGFVLPDGSLGMKWPWIPFVPGDLAVDGRRLDGSAPPAWAEISEGFTDWGRFFPTYLIFPTPGCWEVTGRIGETSLTFVTLVVQVGDGPDWRPPTVP